MRNWIIPACLLSLLALPMAGASPVAYDVGSDFKRFCPQYKDQRAYYRFELKKLERTLRAREAAGLDVSYSTRIFFELEWLIGSTVDYPRIESRLKDLAASLRLETPPPDEQSPSDGLWGAGYTEWFNRLGATYDHVVELAGKGEVPKYPLVSLDPWNSPEGLARHLDALLVTDIRREPVRKRTELNETLSVLVRMILNGLPADYPYHPGLKQALLDYLDRRWQKPGTGFWGAWYRSGERLVKTDDLSITFHIVRYRKGQVEHWTEIIETTLAMKRGEYPFGWLEDGERNTHNLYDAVALLHMGWPHMTEAQRAETRKEMRKILDWCLKTPLRPDGSFEISEADDSLDDAAYFGTSLLVELGYLDVRNRFWTDDPFPGAEAVRDRIRTWIRSQRHPGEGMRSALEKLEE